MMNRYSGTWGAEGTGWDIYNITMFDVEGKRTEMVGLEVQLTPLSCITIDIDYYYSKAIQFYVQWVW